MPQHQKLQHPTRIGRKSTVSSGTVTGNHALRTQTTTVHPEIIRGAFDNTYPIRLSTIIQMQQIYGNQAVSKMFMSGYIKDAQGARPYVKRHTSPTEKQDQVLQRKIGFEYETGIGVFKPPEVLPKPLPQIGEEKSKEPETENLCTPISGDDSLWTVDGLLTVEPDGACIEFQTAAFDEDDDGLKKLDQSLGLIIRLGEAIDSQVGKDYVAKSSEQLRKPPVNITAALENVSKAAGIRHTIAGVDKRLLRGPESGPPPLTGNPQATIGVLPSQLSTVVDYSAQDSPFGRKDMETAPLGLAIDLARKVSLEVTKKQGSTLEALLTMVFQYLLMGKLHIDEQEYAKLTFPVLAKTNLGIYYQSLDKAEKAFFTVKNVLNAAGMPDTGGTPLIAGGYLDSSRKHVPGPNREQWLAGIIEGFDQFSAFKDAKWPAIGMGNMYSEEVGPKPKGLFSFLSSREQGVIMELRRMPHRQNMKEFVANAHEIFNRVVILNNPKKKK